MQQGTGAMSHHLSNQQAILNDAGINLLTAINAVLYNQAPQHSVLNSFTVLLMCYYAGGGGGNLGVRDQGWRK
jgi:hypothetical protein